MDTIYIVILGILLLLAGFDLVVGVSNDAANFLNSAVGSRAASRSVIIAVAAVGVVIGSSFSSGMMEIARSGVFVPAQFNFHDIMLLFLAVMLTDVILLDLFNTFGLPTSTTVSLVFELLGAAVAVAVYNMCTMGDNVVQDISAYINSSKALAIVTGIFASVGVAFTCGIVIMWISRLIFSFRYQKTYKYIGAIWCGLALTAITYFAIFKGLKGSTILDKETVKYLDSHLHYCLLASFAGWTALMFVLQHLCRVNILKFIVLAGTMALALAFAGNDLVNFIGVFMAGQSSYEIAQAHVAAGGNLSDLYMGDLAKPVVADWRYLIVAGLIMVGALMFSKKARTVTDTEVNLARKNSGMERFGSAPPARMLVRYTLKFAQGLTRITPAPIARFIGKRFEPLPASEDNGQAFDLIRASVNLTIAALLISMATSLKLPLSTTYVTFMVAMGSSLADRAWGRDSAVYRITGVMTVIAGWFFTAFAACTAAFICAMVLMAGGFGGIVLMVGVVAALLVKSAIMHKNKHKKQVEELDLGNDNTLRSIGIGSAELLGRVLGIYKGSIDALITENRKQLKKFRKETKEIGKELRDRKNFEIIPSLRHISPDLVDRGQLLFRVTESMQATVESLNIIVQASFSHIDNNHAGLDHEQAQELLALTEHVAKFYPELCGMLRASNYAGLEKALEEATDLSEEFADSIRHHLLRGTEDESQARNSILYLNLLNETRSMIRRSYTLMKDQKELLEG
ncbi:inorganic phosphate transporter [Akkermansia glycaniphila]|uniref:inorganic phosphate transporter n=1 Tax=Akkermansia glycaniphila TaxID=1679444 RepID=UPI001C00B467|nr:inorganic phosphate transporter [Akkermansia glycaniphila]MBT9448610.1 inorganic phosphate transporter [Akkermansia glycaniphila]